jgi:hypothetical protein
MSFRKGVFLSKPEDESPEPSTKYSAYLRIVNGQTSSVTVMKDSPIEKSRGLITPTLDGDESGRGMALHRVIMEAIHNSIGKPSLSLSGRFWPSKVPLLTFGAFLRSTNFGGCGSSSFIFTWQLQTPPSSKHKVVLCLGHSLHIPLSICLGSWESPIVQAWRLLSSPHPMR